MHQLALLVRQILAAPSSASGATARTISGIVRRKTSVKIQTMDRHQVVSLGTLLVVVDQRILRPPPVSENLLHLGSILNPKTSRFLLLMIRDVSGSIAPNVSVAQLARKDSFSSRTLIMSTWPTTALNELI